MDRWVSYDSTVQSLPDFLLQWRPSTTVAPHVEWICVSRLNALRIPSQKTANLMKAWDFVCEARHGNVNAADVKELAQQHNVRTGKWMMYVPSKEVDDVWTKIANAVLAGGLGDDAKVSTLHYREVAPTLHSQQHKGKKRKRLHIGPKNKKPGPLVADTHVICMYTEDFDDVDSVNDVRSKLPAMGFESKMHYKPDAYTFCGIYQNNPWGIPASMFFKQNGENQGI